MIYIAHCDAYEGTCPHHFYLEKWHLPMFWCRSNKQTTKC